MPPLIPSLRPSAISQNIRELKKGPRYQKNLRKFGKSKASKISVAAAYAQGKKKQ